MSQHRDTKAAHSFWAPAHNREERWAETEAAKREAQQRTAEEQRWLRFARRHRITGQAAQRFLALQRASYKRQQEAEAARAQYAETFPHLIACCSGAFHAIVRDPHALRTACCGRVLALIKEA